MKTTIPVTLLLLLSWHCLADDCTSQIDNHIKTLEFITETPNLTDAHKQQAQNELHKISQLRHQLDDCDLITRIPALNKTRSNTTDAESKQKSSQ